MYEGGPNRNTSCCLLPARENRRIAKQQFFTGSKISKAWLQSCKLFLPRRSRDIVVGEKFLYFFSIFSWFFGSRNDRKFLKGTDAFRSAYWAIWTEFCALFFAVEWVFNLSNGDLRGELLGLWVANVLFRKLMNLSVKWINNHVFPHRKHCTFQIDRTCYRYVCWNVEI